MTRGARTGAGDHALLGESDPPPTTCVKWSALIPSRIQGEQGLFGVAACVKILPVLRGGFSSKGLGGGTSRCERVGEGGWLGREQTDS